MYKLFFGWIMIAVSLVACNNNDQITNIPVALPAGEKELRDEISKHPDSLLLQEKLVQYFRENGNYSQAITETEQLEKKDSSNAKTLYMKAMLLSESGDTSKAITAWEKLITINPKPDYVIALGTLYAFTKNPLAIEMADALLQAPKAKAEQQAIFIKGLYYSEIGEKIKAISFFDECLRLDYSYAFAYREKAICLYDLTKYLDALKVLELSVTVNKNNEEAYYWMGRCFEKLGKKEEATQNYQMALQLAPDYVEAKDALAKLGVVQ